MSIIEDVSLTYDAQNITCNFKRSNAQEITVVACFCNTEKNQGNNLVQEIKNCLNNGQKVDLDGVISCRKRIAVGNMPPYEIAYSLDKIGREKIEVLLFAKASGDGVYEFQWRCETTIKKIIYYSIMDEDDCVLNGYKKMYFYIDTLGAKVDITKFSYGVNGHKYLVTKIDKNGNTPSILVKSKVKHSDITLFYSDNDFECIARDN